MRVQDCTPATLRPVGRDLLIEVTDCSDLTSSEDSNALILSWVT
jgi:hypothetical protein